MIIKSAYLGYPVSGTVNIACIVFSDGSESLLLITKRQALECAETFEGISLDGFELKALKEQIHKSELIDKSKELEEFASSMTVQMDQLRRRVEAFVNDIKNHDGDSERWKL